MREISFSTGNAYINNHVQALSHAQEVLEAAKMGMDIKILPTDDLRAFKEVFEEFTKTDEFYGLDEERQDRIVDILVTPPEDALKGTYVVQIKATSRADLEVSSFADISVSVGQVYAILVEPLSSQVEGPVGKWHEVELNVTNLGNGEDVITLDAVVTDGSDIEARFAKSIVKLQGGTWTQVESPTGNWIWAVEHVSPYEAWAVGDSGVILHWEDPARPTPTPLPTKDPANNVSLPMIEK